MNFSMDEDGLSEYVYRQLLAFFPDDNPTNKKIISSCMPDVIDRVVHCFKNINNKYFCDKDGKVFFNHLNGDQYAMFLYFLSNTVWQKYADSITASKIFLLNKTLHGIDAFYEISLPSIFLFVHPLGTVLGRAKYNDYFVVYQGCTVGSVRDCGYPIISREVVMYSNSSILGDCKIGKNVVLGANSYLVNTNVDDDVVIVGQYPNTRMVPNTKHEAKAIFI